MKIKVTLFDTGYCTHNEKMVIKTGRRKKVKFPALFALIQHPKKGNILYDCGYSNRFFELTKRFPYSIYAKLTPVYLKSSDLAISKLKQVGIKPEDINSIIISHFHADHISGLCDFPNAKIICLENAYSIFKNKSNFVALTKGIIKGLLPDDFESRCDHPDLKTRDCKITSYFNNTIDIFGDQSVFGVELPGHAKGQLGLYIEDSNLGELFFISDSCWVSKSFKENIPPSGFAHLISDNKKEYLHTLNQIHHIYNKEKDIKILPSHCGEVFNSLVKNTSIDINNMNGVH